MIRIISAIVAFMVASTSFWLVPTQKTRLEKNIKSATEERINNGKLTGAHIYVSRNSEEIYNKTFGKKSAGGEALADNATYRIASMTKPVTAVAMLIEYQRGHLDIYKNVEDYLPEFADMQVVSKFDEQGKILETVPATEKLKVYQLVSHTSGIMCGGLLDVYYSNYTIEHNEGLTMQEMVKYYSTMPLAFNPGTAQAYSTAAFDVAAQIILNVSGETDFEEYLKKNIFEPLGMVDTTFKPTPEQFERMVAVHDMDTDTGAAVDAPTPSDRVFGGFPVTYYAAGAGLMSTMADYIKFAEMLQNNGKAQDGTVILNEDMVKLMATPVPEMSNGIMSGDTQWGLAVRVIVKPSYKHGLPVGSFGWSGAYGTHFWIDPISKITAVYMKNSFYDGGAGAQTANEFEECVYRAMVPVFLLPII